MINYQTQLVSRISRISEPSTAVTWHTAYCFLSRCDFLHITVSPVTWTWHRLKQQPPTRHRVRKEAVECLNSCQNETWNLQRHAWVVLSLDAFNIHPRKLTWNPNMEVWKMIFLFKGMVFMFHVSFRGSIICNYFLQLSEANNRRGTAEEPSIYSYWRLEAVQWKTVMESLSQTDVQALLAHDPAGWTCDCVFFGKGLEYANLKHFHNPPPNKPGTNNYIPSHSMYHLFIYLWVWS